MKIEKIVATILQANNYVVGDDKECIIIDASAKLEDIKRVVNGRKVFGVFLTHGHWDHALKIDEIQKEFNCKVYLDENAISKLKNTNRSFYGEVLVNSQISIENFCFLKDKEILNFGNIKIEIIKTPGHTNCSLCFKVSDDINELIFTGDTLFENGIGRCDLPTGNFSDIKISVKKLLSLDKNLTVYPGHGGATTIYNEQINHAF